MVRAKILEPSLDESVIPVQAQVAGICVEMTTAAIHKERNRFSIVEYYKLGFV